VAVSGSLKATVMDGEAINRSLKRIAHEIVERNKGVEDLVVVGVLSKGYPLAWRLAALLGNLERCAVPVGAIDPSPHRDDLHLGAVPAKDGLAEVPDIDGKTVVLVDDVIWHGRTVRAAMDALIRHGRPRAIQLAVLIDRGHRELPIRPDYVGKNVPTSNEERVQVLWAEIDGIDRAVILQDSGA
jgi:pyrimidine operon attenuation protein / uracil phosphoribosyltransferase